MVTRHSTFYAAFIWLILSTTSVRDGPQEESDQEILQVSSETAFANVEPSMQDVVHAASKLLGNVPGKASSQAPEHARSQVTFLQCSAIDSIVKPAFYNDQCQAKPKLYKIILQKEGPGPKTVGVRKTPACEKNNFLVRRLEFNEQFKVQQAVLMTGDKEYVQLAANEADAGGWIRLFGCATGEIVAEEVEESDKDGEQLGKGDTSDGILILKDLEGKDNKEKARLKSFGPSAATVAGNDLILGTLNIIGDASNPLEFTPGAKDIKERGNSEDWNTLDKEMSVKFGTYTIHQLIRDIVHDKTALTICIPILTELIAELLQIDHKQQDKQRPDAEKKAKSIDQTVWERYEKDEKQDATGVSERLHEDRKTLEHLLGTCQTTVELHGVKPVVTILKSFESSFTGKKTCDISIIELVKESSKFDLDLDNKWMPDDGRRNPLLFALAPIIGSKGDEVQFNSCLEDEQKCLKDILSFYEKKFTELFDPPDKPVSVAAASLLLWDLSCFKFVTNHKGDMTKFASFSYMCEKQPQTPAGNDLSPTPRPSMLKAILQPIKLLKHHKSQTTSFVIGCQEMPKEIRDLEEALPANLSIWRMDAKGKDASTASGFIYSNDLKFVDKTDEHRASFKEFLFESQVPERIIVTTMRKILVGEFTLRDEARPHDSIRAPGWTFAVVNFHCKSFKEQVVEQANFVTRALELVAKKCNCEAFGVGDMNIEAKWPKKYGFGERVQAVKEAEKGMMPKEVAFQLDEHHLNAYSTDELQKHAKKVHRILGNNLVGPVPDQEKDLRAWIKERRASIVECKRQQKEIVQKRLKKAPDVQTLTKAIVEARSSGVPKAELDRAQIAWKKKVQDQKKEEEIQSQQPKMEEKKEAEMPKLDKDCKKILETDEEKSEPRYLVTKFGDTFKDVKAAPPSGTITTLKMRTLFQAQAKKAGELTVVQKDFVFVNSKHKVEWYAVGGLPEPEDYKTNLDLLQPSTRWPGDHFAVFCGITLHAKNKQEIAKNNQK